jgi:hypothetical protein
MFKDYKRIFNISSILILLKEKWFKKKIVPYLIPMVNSSPIVPKSMNYTSLENLALLPT